MEIKKVIKQDGEYQCDIDVTVEEWKKILQDKTIMNKNYVDVLLKFYSEPEHKSTCKELGIKYDKSPQSFNSTITNFAKAVKKKLNRFEVIGTDGESSFWIIAMTGKYKGEHFEWTMRPELVIAIEEIDIRNTIQFDMDYFNLTEENIALLSNDIGKKYEVNNKGSSIYFDTRKKLKYLGRLLSEELELNLSNNYNEKPNKQAGRGKGFVLKEYILAGFIPEKYHKETGNNLFIKLSFWGFDTDKPHFGIDIDVNFSDDRNQFNKLRDLFQKQYWSIPINDFPNNWTDLIDLVKPHFQQMADYIDSYFSKIEVSKEMTPCIELLKANKNLILTGAPGTGKTFLAKQIANKIGEWEFVQFHPSFDYTDFVEGLRPLKKDSGELGFELKDGIFKAFCKKALCNLIDSKKSKEELKKEDIVLNNISEFLDKCIDDGDELEISTGNKFTISEYNESHIKVKVPNNAITSDLTLSFNELYQLLLNDYKLNKVKDIREFFSRSNNRQSDSYIFTLYNNSNLIKELKTDSDISRVERKDYVFIIDEINRAEISKVFGELFFSIDSDYRGEKGKVKTQYSNLQDESDVFYDGFYIPENVYIIGTMNDIDRSVESMDFAMRRRFAWKEVTALERITMWNGQIENWKEESKKRMIALNNAIEDVQGLSSAYHIGPAYFLKLENYKENPFEQLWENHLKGVIFEYLRGLPNSVEELKNLKLAYDLKNDVENI